MWLRGSNDDLNENWLVTGTGGASVQNRRKKNQPKDTKVLLRLAVAANEAANKVSQAARSPGLRTLEEIWEGHGPAQAAPVVPTRLSWPVLTHLRRFRSVLLWSYSFPTVLLGLRQYLAAMLLISSCFLAGFLGRTFTLVCLFVTPYSGVDVIDGDEGI